MSMHSPNIVRLPRQALRDLQSGVKLLAIQRQVVPIVELRLRFTAHDVSIEEASLVARTLVYRLEGSPVPAFTGGVRVTSSPDRILVSGACMSADLREALALLCNCLCQPAVGLDTFHALRDELIGRSRSRLTDVGSAADAALAAKYFGSHRYARRENSIDVLSAIAADHVESVSRRILSPSRCQVTAVAPGEPDGIVDLIQAALEIMPCSEDPGPADLLAPEVRSGQLALARVRRTTGAAVRLALPAPPRGHANYPALFIANQIFGGAYSGRLAANLRERRGIAYAPMSQWDHRAAHTSIVANANMSGTAIVAAVSALFEELSSMQNHPPDDSEVERARRLAIGSLITGSSSARGVADLSCALLAAGLTPRFTAELAKAVTQVSSEDVREVGRYYFRADHAVTAVAGDESAVDALLAQQGP